MRVVILCLILAAFALRLVHFGVDSLWYDETFSAYLSAQSLGELIAHTARDIHPPGYYLLLSAWRSVSHPSVSFGLEFLLGWPSIFSGVLVVVLTAALTRRLFGTRTAIVALALAAIHPTEVWFAQEARMYAPAAMIYLAVLWVSTDLLALPEAHKSNSKHHYVSILAYGVLVAAALYTLYYSLFWLLALNLFALLDLWRRPHATRIALHQWVIANLLAFLLWLPWLPTFVRQVLSPPVAPWREPWASISEQWAAVTEMLAALLVGHTPPLEMNWPWAILALVLIVAALLAAGRRYRRALTFSVGLLLIPSLTMLLVTLFGLPIYFVRYVAPFAVLMPTVTAVLLSKLDIRPVAIIAAVVILVQAASLHALWSNPMYGSDDHRAAVADLADAWRPGDAILVNAGWVYTAIATYWPDELASPLGTIPPPVDSWPRLTALTSDTPLDLTRPVVFRSGTVDGGSSLGWGLPQSDFYPMSEQETVAAVTTLAEQAPRIWHYRLYDTVNDPTGVIRRTLSENGSASYQRTYSGPGYLLLERYDSERTLAEGQVNAPLARYASGWVLADHAAIASANAGEILYTTTTWIADPEATAEKMPNMGLSLRLVDDKGTVYARADNALPAVNASNAIQLRHALPIPAATPPGGYSLILLAYDPTTLQQVAPQADITSPITEAIMLDTVELALPTEHPHLPRPMARFDYLHLIDTSGLPTEVVRGGEVRVDMIWASTPSEYQDNYQVEFALQGEQGEVAQTWTVMLGTTDYPSAVWVPEMPVRRLVTLPISADVSPGNYTLTVSIQRASDGLGIPQRDAWRPRVNDPLPLGAVAVAEGN